MQAAATEALPLPATRLPATGADSKGPATPRTSCTSSPVTTRMSRTSITSRTSSRSSRSSASSYLYSASSTYSVQEQIGRGSFGRVVAAVDEETQQHVAIKILDLTPKAMQGGGEEGDVSSVLLRKAEAEAHVWSQVQQHPNVLGLLRSFVDGIRFCFVMAHCAGGTLEDCKNDLWRLPLPEVTRLFKEMTLGVDHVHRCRVVHRDIKPSNFLLGGPACTTVMLADFGLAVTLPERGRLRGVFGTPPYMSPEMAGNCGHSTSTDVWSLGASCYLLFLGSYPYAPDLMGKHRCRGEAFKESIAKDILPPTFMRLDPRDRTHQVNQPPALFVCFLRSLLNRNAQKRVTIEGALQDIEMLMAPGSAEIASSFGNSRNSTMSL